MGRPKGKRTERDDVTTKANRAVISKARLVAAHRGVDLAELITETLQPGIDKAYVQMLRELEAGLTESHRKPAATPQPRAATPVEKDYGLDDESDGAMNQATKSKPTVAREPDLSIGKLSIPRPKRTGGK